jgi:hypothetical protein
MVTLHSLIATQVFGVDDQSQLSHSQRGIMYTIDALFTGLILLASLAVAYNVAPTDGVAQENIDQQQLDHEFESLYDIAVEKGDLLNATLYWDDSNGEWVNAGFNDHYVSPPASHPLTPYLERLEERGYAYRIVVEYLDGSGDTQQQAFATQGTPTSDAISQTRVVRLRDDYNLTGPSSGTEIQDASTYFAPDAFSSSNQYNILRVKILLWRP